MSLDRARLYDRALTASEVAASNSGEDLFISDKEVLLAFSPDQKTKKIELTKKLQKAEFDLPKVPLNRDLRKMQLCGHRLATFATAQNNPAGRRKLVDTGVDKPAPESLFRQGFWPAAGEVLLIYSCN